MNSDGVRTKVLVLAMKKANALGSRVYSINQNYSWGQDMERAIEAIMQAAHTGRIGDGKIFVSTIDEAIRIRTGERGPEAV